MRKEIQMTALDTPSESRVESTRSEMRTKLAILPPIGSRKGGNKKKRERKPVEGHADLDEIKIPDAPEAQTQFLTIVAISQSPDEHYQRLEDVGRFVFEMNDPNDLVSSVG